LEHGREQPPGLDAEDRCVHMLLYSTQFVGKY
jgi:hypothetical protein